MSWRIAWLLIAQTIGLGLGLWLRARNHPDAGFWMLAATLVLTCAWLVWDNLLGVRILRWMQKDILAQRPWAYNLWREVADAATVQQRKQLHETRLAEEKLAAFLDAIQALPIGVVLLDGVGRMEWFNLIAAEHLGFNNPQDLQQHIIHLVRDPQFVQYWLQPHSGNNAGVIIYGRKHSAQSPVKLAMQYFHFGDGKRLLLSRDVTALEQADRMRRDFVSNVSHEIRTPLTVLSGFVETLQSIPLDKEQASHYLALMAEQAQRMQTLVNDLLALSRLEGNQPLDHSEHIAVANLLDQCLLDAQALSRVLGNSHEPMHRITLKSSISPELQIQGSYTELRSAVSNLLSNAVRYTPAGGEIELQAQLEPEGNLRISVCDTGPGIPTEHLARVTERFYRIDKSRSRETGGTGLGLAIVKHVAQRHGATLDIQSKVGQGSCFSLLFPTQRLLMEEGADHHGLLTLRAFGSTSESRKT
ncbi:MAG: phosphate regulon sensor histidine kinase PhoR [Brachymonas sp.]|nr:phosphate regulon sensor histidine kinase PhoR [Brachymonas sp.]